MEIQDNPDTINLRPHHIASLEGNVLDMEYSLFGDKKAVENREKFAHAYGIDLLGYMDYLSVLIARKTGLKIKLVKGTDDICKKCQHNSNCERRDYEPVRQQLAKFIPDLDPNLNPDLADNEIIAGRRLEYDKPYSARELFSVE